MSVEEMFLVLSLRTNQNIMRRSGRVIGVIAYELEVKGLNLAHRQKLSSPMDPYEKALEGPIGVYLRWPFYAQFHVLIYYYYKISTSEFND